MIAKNRGYAFVGFMVFAFAASGLMGCGSDAVVAGPNLTKVDASTDDDGGAQADNAQCASDQCAIDEQCIDDGQSNPDNPCEICRTLVAVEQWTADDSASCDDGDACTDVDTCNAGQCVGKSSLCDDANPCTDDTCKADGGCLSTANQAPCSDGDICTIGDSCDNSTCKAGKARSCDDGNVCTEGSCESGKGCVQAAKTVTCDDGNACSEADTCTAGVCKAGNVKSCDDNDVCTVDACDPLQGCISESLTELCEDNNVCTDDSCDSVKGCVYGLNTKPCDDNNLCTTTDMCGGGVCKGQAVSSSDGNPCTDDSCDPIKGVTNVANNLPCDDGDKCSLNDTCAKSKCVAGAESPKCDDNNLCTNDSCTPKDGCVQIPNSLACNDDDACTDKDFCNATKCQGQAITCDDKNACTADSCDAKKGCVFTIKVTNACRPNISVDFPPRGATIKSSIGFIEVKGSVKSGAGPIKSLTLNGGKLTVKADGSFKKVIQVTSGGNTLVFVAKDSLGTERKRVQAFLWSNNYRKPIAAKVMSGATDPGIAYYLSKQAIDDGKHDLPPNDLATIFEIFMQSFDIGAILPSPAYDQGGLKVTLSNLKYGKAKVSMSPVPGAFRLVATVPNLTSDLKAQFGWFSPNGKLTIKAIKIEADVVPTVVNYKLVVDLKNVKISLDGFDIKLSGLASLLNGIVAGLKDTFVTSLQTSFADTIKKEIGPVVASAFSALAISFPFAIPALDGSNEVIQADVKTDFSKVSIDDKGSVFWLRAQGSSKKSNTVDNLGIPDRIGCGTGIQEVVVPQKDPLELTLSDDTLNQVMYALWLGGMLEFTIPASFLGQVDLTQYGVTNLKMKAKALLAPTVSDCNPKKELQAHIGDMLIEASMELLGQKLDVELWITVAIGVDVKLAKNAKGNSELSIGLTEVKSLDIEANIKQDNLIGSETVIAGLVGDNLVSGLLGSLGGGALGSFELPTIDLSGAVKGLPPGTGIAIAPKTIVRKAGNTIVGGALK
ncbi:MAG: hypothetical protein CMH53_03720 [Myxococcales bacterium]|nr:hypothetical protein [Myxococcales bacterium]